MRCLFIANYRINENANGVAKKICNQIKSLKDIGVDVDYVGVEESQIKFYKGLSEHVLCREISQFHKYWDTMLDKLSKILDEEYDFLYFRLDYISNKMLMFLKYCKKHVKKICVEIPTMQHKPEPGARFTSILAFYFRNIYYSKLKKYVDKIATFSDDEYIYGIPTIQIENCINVDDIEVYNYNLCDKELKMIGVAMMTPSHGFDRVIKGISDYYSKGGKNKITFYIVGDGEIRGQWQQLANELNVSEHVFFTGKKSGKELDELFSKSNIAVASLAIFRKKCMKCSELKIREYFHRGIPFIYSANEPCISEFNDLYCKKVAHDETAININEIIDFANNIDYNAVSLAMHDYAVKNFRWETQFQKIIKELGCKNENLS